jgi:hypothetical protein
MASVLLKFLELMLPNRSSNAHFARRMGIAFAVSSTSDVCVPKLLRSHIDEDITCSDMTILMSCRQKVNQSYIMITVSIFDESSLQHDVY